MDREKIIKGLEVCTSIADGESCPKECPYYQEVCYGYDQLMRDALDLLKEDCHNCKLECLLRKYDELKEKYDALLKEQEPVVPLTIDDAVSELMDKHYKRLKRQETEGL